MRRTLAVLALLPALTLAQASPTASPPPRELLAQVDDSDLKSEESLEELMAIEYDKKSWSVSKAVALSFLPGAGWGLVYAEKKAQSSVPFLLSAAGYALAGVYFAGVFDESTSDVCNHVRAGVVGPLGADDGTDGNLNGLSPCDVAADRRLNKEVDDLSDNQMRKYFETESDYKKKTTGEDVDGKETGLYILVGTYIGTSLIGAIWSGLVVADHNEQLRKDIEATVKAPDPVPVPVIAFDGDRGYLGVQVTF